MASDFWARLTAAAERTARRPSSDFDLNRDITLPPGRRLRPAGVLVAVTDAEDGPRLILTKRSSALRHHPGQIAFPGGKVDGGDDGPIGAALREAGEEIGLARADAEVLATLGTHETVTGFAVTPVLARVRPFTPVPEAGEVDEVFCVPAAHVLEPENYRIEGREWQGTRRLYFTVPWGPYYIWGATARILRSLAEEYAA